MQSRIEYSDILMGKYKDITGQRFGKLVAIKPTDKRQGTNIIWLFKCDCGNDVEKVTSHLTYTSSCGCVAWHSLRKDITGQRFGRLVAVRPTEKKANGGRVWEFICDCGNRLEAPISKVTSGNTNSCGCYRTDIVREINYVDLSGRRFGMLEVIGKSKETKNGALLWECRCDCGKIVQYTTNQLNTGAKLNCGCNPNYKFFCVYKHVFTDGKVYIGKTSRMPIYRWQTSGYYSGQYAIARAIAETGSDNWIDLIDHYYLSKKDEWVKWTRSLGFNDTNLYSKNGAEKLEKKWIAIYNSTDPALGLNSSSGGDSGFTLNNQTRERISANLPRLTGEDSPSFGRKHTAETKAIISQKAKERILRTGVVNFKGKHHSEETKQKLRASHLGKYDGEKNPFWGKHHSQDTKDIISEENRKPITQYDLQGHKIHTYESLRAAAEAFKTTSSSISACVNKRTANSMGYIWRHLDVEQLPEAEMPMFGHGLSKAVLQYDMQGNLLNRYPSLKQAAIATGLSSSSISRAIKQREDNATSGGYQWCYESESDHNNSNTKIVYQYRLDGGLIAAYNSVKGAAESTGFKAKGISSAARGHIDTYMGYIWSYSLR